MIQHVVGHILQCETQNAIWPGNEKLKKFETNPKLRYGQSI